jgi:hypothetical protein
MALDQTDVDMVRRLILSRTSKRALCSLLDIDDRTLKKFIQRYNITEPIPSLPRTKPTRALKQHAKSVIGARKFSDHLKLVQLLDPDQTSVLLRALSEDPDYLAQKAS